MCWEMAVPPAWACSCSGTLHACGVWLCPMAHTWCEGTTEDEWGMTSEASNQGNKEKYQPDLLDQFKSLF